MILECLLQKSLYLFDTDKPAIGRPVLELFVYWVQAHAKLTEISADVLQKMAQALQVLIKRLAFPAWASLDVEPDEREAEYAQYRQDMTTLFLNLAMNKLFHQHVLTTIHGLLERLNPASTPVRSAEVPLLLVFNLIQSIA